jgi:hypothetical protein
MRGPLRDAPEIIFGARGVKTIDKFMAGPLHIFHFVP